MAREPCIVFQPGAGMECQHHARHILIADIEEGQAVQRVGRTRIRLGEKKAARGQKVEGQRT